MTLFPSSFCLHRSSEPDLQINKRACLVCFTPLCSRDLPLLSSDLLHRALVYEEIGSIFLIPVSLLGYYRHSVNISSYQASQVTFMSTAALSSEADFQWATHFVFWVPTLFTPAGSLSLRIGLSEEQYQLQLLIHQAGHFRNVPNVIVFLDLYCIQVYVSAYSAIKRACPFTTSIADLLCGTELTFPHRSCRRNT